MKRRNVQQAFVGEGGQDALAEGNDGDDAVEFDLRGGRIMLTAAGTTPDDQALGHQGYPAQLALWAPSGTSMPAKRSRALMRSRDTPG